MFNSTLSLRRLTTLTSSYCKCHSVSRNGSRLSNPNTCSISLTTIRSISGSRSALSPEVSSSSSLQTKPPPPLPPGGVVKQKWDLFVGVVLERKPLLSQEMTPLENEYANLLSKYEFEMSKKSDHEVRKEKDFQIMEKIKSGEMEIDHQASSQTAQDQEDLWATEVKSFQAASRKTEADTKNDQKSLERALDSHLLLVIEQKLGNNYKWMCPHGKWQEGETMRQTTERTLKEVCPEMKAKVLGNAPWGVYKYKYPKKTIATLNTPEPSIGAKVFFYKAQIISGEISLSGKKSNSGKDSSSSLEMKDFVWLKRNELESKLNPDYYRHLAEILIDENH